jgi:5-methylcytosine-specific restriction endonuclease McrA
MFCGLKKWQGKDIPLELHHVNSDRMDNSLENIVILCPNCHALEHKK